MVIVIRAAEARERGAATIWGLGLMAVLLVVALSVTVVGTVRVARHKAQNAADLSALAAAREAITAPDTACRSAAWIAIANGAELVECGIEEGVADVRVSVRLQLFERLRLPGPRHVTGRARAAPLGWKRPLAGAADFWADDGDERSSGPGRSPDCGPRLRS
jgi:secretion/DNA translocation related TadE-like protein